MQMSYIKIWDQFQFLDKTM